MKAASAKGAKVVWAVADHPWVDEVGGADIRVAMTVIAGRTGPVSLVEVDEQGRVVDELKTNRLNPDLSARVSAGGSGRRTTAAGQRSVVGRRLHPERKGLSDRG